MVLLQLLFAVVPWAFLRTAASEAAGSCSSGSTEEGCSSSLADLMVAEDEEEAPLHLLQRRQMRRVKEYREALKATEAEESSSKARWPPPPFDFQDPGYKYSSFIEDNEKSDPPPLTPMTVAKPKRRRSLDLHFNAVVASCGAKLSDPARCTKAVEQSSKKVFVQLHVEARMDETVPPLTKQETKSFEDRFQDLVLGDSKRVMLKSTKSAQYAGWKNLVQNGYMAMRPVVPLSLTNEINKLNQSGESNWTAVYDPSFIQVSVAKGKSKLGFIMTKEEEEEAKNHTLSMLEEDLKQFTKEELSKEAWSEHFDVRENWPECKPVTTHVRYQTCNNCWSHSTALITESRLCIQTRGRFNGPQAWLSQSYIAACRTDGHDYCLGGSGLLGFRTVSRWGVPTGGPDFRGNIQEGIETCYPQVQPYDTQVHCPGACSPYTRYPRPLDQDLFYVQYEPRVVHNVGRQVPYLVQKALMTEGPILLGMKIYQDFYAYQSGIYKPVLKSWNRYMGGHAVTGMGFGPGYIIAINSWSESWGIRGAFHVAPEAVNFGFFLPGAALGSAGGSPYPMPLPNWR